MKEEGDERRMRRKKNETKGEDEQRIWKEKNKN